MAEWYSVPSLWGKIGEDGGASKNNEIIRNEND